MSEPVKSRMVEASGDIWEHAGRDIIVITTNGSLTRDGRIVPGSGVTLQATVRFPWLAAKLGCSVRVHGSHVFALGEGIVSFPVEETAWSLPDPRIISRSAEELRQLADCAGWQRILVPRPGCGGGGLLWKDVRPLLEPWFDSRFTVISQEK